MLPVDIVLHPSWWFKNEAITFDEDFFYNPARRVEVERKMEKALYQRWEQFGLGKDRGNDLPVIGAIHLAAGFLISEMMGCKVIYKEDAAPQVIGADLSECTIDPEAAFKSPAFKKFSNLTESLKAKYGYLVGDVNFAGILNIALDLRGENIFLDMLTNPQEVKKQFTAIADVITKFTHGIEKETNSSSVSVNRLVRHLDAPLYLHSECSHTMISTDDYEKHLLDFDINWSKQKRPFGIHYCGKDPHRYAEVFAKIDQLDFLDVGWGGDVKILRQHLPRTFLNIRLSPVEIIEQSTSQIRDIITQLVKDSGNPWLTGICCINMDYNVTDDKITTIFETVANLRKEKD